MFRRKREGADPLEATVEFAAFRRTLDAVQRARDALISAAPTGRTAGVPLAEALLAFGYELEVAGQRMPGWNIRVVSTEWAACKAAVEEARGMADALRLGEPPEGYEQLYAVLGDILEPLEAFDRAAGRFRELGYR